MSSRSTRSARSATPDDSTCPACKNPANQRMVSCCHCRTWWHYDCVGVDDTISAADRTFNCPRCQKPSPTIPPEERSRKKSSKASGSKASKSGASSTSSIRARRARLQLEKLEAEQALATKILEQERREQALRHEQERLLKDAEIEQAKLRMEKAILEERFRIQQEELDDEDDDRSSVLSLRSRTSKQSSISKVEQWKTEQTIEPVEEVASTDTVPTTTASSHDEPSTSGGPDGQLQGQSEVTIEEQQVPAAPGIPLVSKDDTSFCGMITNVTTSSCSQILGTVGSQLIPLSSHTQTPVRSETEVPQSSGQLVLYPLPPVCQTQSYNHFAGVSSTVTPTPGGPPCTTVSVSVPQVISSVRQQPLVSSGLPGAGIQGVPSTQPPWALPSNTLPGQQQQLRNPCGFSQQQPPGVGGLPGAGIQGVPSTQPPWALPSNTLPGQQQQLRNPCGFSQQQPPGVGGLPGASVQGVPSTQPWSVPFNMLPGQQSQPPRPSHGFFNHSVPGLIGQYGVPVYTSNSVPPPGFGLGPTPQQIAARQVMSKELPNFSGNPEEWPLFISSYRNSTQVCGYTEAENLARLQRCLKGSALDVVRSRLLLPAGVPQVIATLEMMYGRPELLIHTLLQKVRAVPSPKHDRLDTLIAFGVAVQNLSDHLEAGGQHAHYNNPMLLAELVEKLPANLKLDWSLYKQRWGEVDIRVFSQYMTMLVRAATDVTLYDPRQQSTQQHRTAKPEKGGKDKSFCGSHTVEESKQGKDAQISGSQNRPSQPACLLCQDSAHRVKDCTLFSRKTVDDRWKTIKQYTLCRQCLGAHGRRPCKSQQRCEVGGCQMKHHPLLHSTQEKSNPKSSESEAVVSYHKTEQLTLFRIVPVTLYGNNRSVSVYAFLDDGSSTTLIDEGVVKELGVTGERLPLCLQWTANVKRSEDDSQRVRLEISGSNHGTKYHLADVRTVSRLDLPKQTLRYAELAKAFPHLKGLPLEDYTNAHPRILIGNNHAHVTATLKIREGRAGDPIAAKSRLGWTIFGSSFNNTAENAHSFLICECDRDQTLHEMVEQYFSVDNVGVTAAPSPQSNEEQRANRILADTTKRVGMRFESGLLWKYDNFEFPDNYAMAERRLQCLERRIRRDPVIGESVKRQLMEYQTKGYLHKATKKELEEADPRRTWYLPLGVTINPKKPSKIRIFCDAAATVDGVSLNTMLIKGPDLLNSLLAVLFGFREKRVAVCADLQEMFHQVKIRKEDRHAQRILWRDEPNQEPSVYLMDVATFGATCSPCTAQYIKNLNAEEHAQEFPAAADAIIRKHYVDDYLDSADSVEEAVRLAQDVRYVHSRGGFHLRNWLSNSEEVLRRVGERDPDSEKCLLLDQANSTERVLGMFWRPEQDVFTYTYAASLDEATPTKRQVLRVVMSLFDPLGLLSHFLIFGKIIIQQIWRAKTGWDEPIPKEICERWIQWTAEFQYLDQVSIPRCYFPQRSVKDISSLQLHIFVDAGEDAYACVAYLRAEFSGQVQCALIGGKSKVAPLKALSIPRLELMAAVIGVRLRKTIMNSHSLPINRCVLWSDSKTVLAWINSEHRNYRQFVACRIGEILSKSRVEEWRWIPSRENVADDASKWGRGPCLATSGRWFTGPDFLLLPEELWPADVKPSLETTTEEMKSCLVHQPAAVEVVIDWTRFSQWKRLWRSVGFVNRFWKNRLLKDEKERQRGPLTQNELSLAERSIWRQIQRESYPEEMKTLTENQHNFPMRQAKLDGTSKLRKLSPFLDAYGVIRLDTRIVAASCVSYDTRCPIVLPKEHLATRLLIEWYHRKYLHANAETVVNEVRQRFHVSNLRTMVRQISKACTLCKIRKANPQTPRMAPLPVARLRAFERPFSYIGLDYFGPTLVRVNRGEAKRWIALFTCLTIRAVHLEVVHTLSTESCKMALRRFIARRGAPIEIHSDRGTNFVGTNNELRKEIANIDGQLAEVFTNADTKWVFNPPGTPHMGGAWERLVRSVKTALAAMYTTRTPNEETLITLVVEAEGVVNSRPLTFIPLEAEQQEALTPNHFLLLSSSGVVQTPQTLADTRSACRSNWNLGRVMVDQFWRRWVREYLPSITRRTKWFDDVQPISNGDLVIVVEDGVRNGWTRGRVLEVIAGPDGRIRQAIVQTATGLIRRSVAKLARLDLEESKAGREDSDQPYGSGNCNGSPH